MAEYYRHRQIGSLMIVAFSACIILLAVLLCVVEFNWIAVAVGGVLLVCLLAVWSLTVVIDEDTLHIRFGSGIVRKTLPLRNIESCRSVRNPWYYGWRIKWIPRGWVFDVSGFRVVEVVMNTGKRYRIGTDEPEALERAIRRSIERVSK